MGRLSFCSCELLDAMGKDTEFDNFCERVDASALLLELYRVDAGDLQVRVLKC